MKDAIPLLGLAIAADASHHVRSTEFERRPFCSHTLASPGVSAALKEAVNR